MSICQISSVELYLLDNTLETALVIPFLARTVRFFVPVCGVPCDRACARYPRHRLSSIEFRINIGRKRRSSEKKSLARTGPSPKVGNKVRGCKEKSPGFWRGCSLFRLAPSFLKQRVSLLQPVFAVTLLYAESAFL